MPRGNDAGAVATANFDQYGVHANAEDLIKAQQATVDPAVQKVLNTNYDEVLTEKVKADLSAVEDKFDLGDGEVLLDAAVHVGGALIGVIEGVDGRTRKELVGYDDSWKGARLSPEQQRQREAVLAEAAVAREAARVREDAADRVRKAELDAQREADERIAQIRREADERVAKAEAEAREALETPPAEPTPGTPSEQEQQPGDQQPPADQQGGDEERWPGQHDALDKLAKDNNVDLPEGWDDREKFKVAEKVEFLKAKGVKPASED